MRLAGTNDTPTGEEQLRLYHMSEEPDIVRFVPRPPPSRPEDAPVVWAIDEAHLVHYLFPRDCPRVIYADSDAVSEEDRSRFFSMSAARKIIAVERAWYERIRDGALYQYRFASEGFVCADAIAGYYTTTEPVEPVSVARVDRLLDRIVAADCELRFTPSLFPLRDAILASTLTDFSIIRFRNAGLESAESC
ncbi:DUF6886 family protein [Cohnella sp. REN36]|uniref:DUF6886 family protein n=1 Tax=Cohnella sp. REN36 TaxID=2887347 RepID=UPI001D13AA81|nr:hypothetical protein [Cohnella sp. REN36]